MVVSQPVTVLVKICRLELDPTFVDGDSMSNVSSYSGGGLSEGGRAERWVDLSHGVEQTQEMNFDIILSQKSS